jgi:branched-chain amino acid transport system permease protein
MRADVASPVVTVPALHRGVRGLLGVHPALVAGFAGFLVVPHLASTYWTYNVMAGLAFAIACLGTLVLVGWAREISLMQAGLAGSAMYMCLYVLADDPSIGKVGWPFPLAAAFGIAFSVLVSLLTAIVSARLAGPYVIVLTLSVQFLLENSVMVDSRLVGGLGHWTYARPDFFGIGTRADARFYYLVVGCLLVVTVFLHRARNSRFGRSMILVGSDPVAAACVGVSPWRYRIWAFAVAGALAGLSGVVSGPVHFSPTGILPWLSFNSVVYLAVPVLAGFDSIAGTVAVAVALTLLPQVWLEAKLSVYLLGGICMIVGCLLGPRGLARLVPRG